ncbi:MAG: AAA family ATPase [Nitrososphaerales archaeon]
MLQLPLDAFTDEYLPEVVIDREEEKQIIKEYLQDVLKGRKKVLYIHGVPGIGKTTVTKHIVSQFEDSYNAEVIYVNSECSTPNEALKRIHDLICGEVERKLPSSILVNKILNKGIKEKDFTLVIVLDNFDKMEHVDNLLWNINAIAPKFPRLGLILISTSELKLRNIIGNRLYDRLNPESYEFRPYNAERLYEIINARTSEAYDRKIAEDEALLELCSFVADNGGNVRYLFSLFLDALDLAQHRELKKITLEAVQEIIQKEKRSKIKNSLKELSQNELEVLKVIAKLTVEGKVIHTGLVKEAMKSMPLRTLEYCLKNLQEKRFIELKRIKKGNGYSQSINLIIEPNLVLK